MKVYASGTLKAFLDARARGASETELAALKAADQVARKERQERAAARSQRDRCSNVIRLDDARTARTRGRVEPRAQ